MALQDVAAGSIGVLADLLPKAGNSRTTYLISEVLKHLSSAASSKTDPNERKTEAGMAQEQLKNLLESGVVPEESLEILKSLRANLSAELQ
jgi:hypothetical protein